MFKKYFVHFTAVLIVIFSVFALLCINDTTMPIMVPLITFPISILVYAIPMAFLFSKKAKLVDLKLNINENTMDRIDEIIINKMKRKKKAVVDGKTIYSMENIYFRWLTNAVEVRTYNDHILVRIPEQYKDYLLNTR